MINPIRAHYSLENPASIYDEEALTALQLAGRTTATVNECVKAVNNIPQKVKEDVQAHIDNGDFSRQIDKHTAELKQAMVDQANAVDASLENTTEALTADVERTTSNLTARLDAQLSDLPTDAEIQDARVDGHGTTHANLGVSIRNQANAYAPKVIFFGQTYNLVIDTVAKTAELTLNKTKQTLLYGIQDRMKTTAIPAATVDTPVIDFSGVVGAVGLFMNIANPTSVTFWAKTVATSNWAPGADDILLAIVYYDNVYPVSLPYENIKVNGTYLMKPLDGTRRNCYQSAILFYRGKLDVDERSRLISMYAGTYIGVPFYKTGVKSLSVNLKIIYEVSGVIQFVVYNYDADTLEAVDRNYVFKDGDFCLGYLYAGKFVPVELPSDNVQYSARNPLHKTGHTFMRDYFSGMDVKDGGDSDPFNIVLLGDSITHGSGGTGFDEDGDLVVDTGTRQWHRNTKGYCWANLFKSYIESNYNATVTNNAMRGAWSDQINTYMQDLVPEDTDLVILMCGTNERNAKPGYGITTKYEALSYFDTCLSGIVNHCHKQGTAIILCTAIPASAENENSDYLLDIHEVNTVTKEVASRFDMDMVDTYNEMFYYCMDHGINYEGLLGDGLHPNDEGYRLLFYRMLKALGLNPHWQYVN